MNNTRFNGLEVEAMKERYLQFAKAVYNLRVGTYTEPSLRSFDLIDPVTQEPVPVEHYGLRHHGLIEVRYYLFPNDQKDMYVGIVVFDRNCILRYQHHPTERNGLGVNDASWEICAVKTTMFKPGQPLPVEHSLDQVLSLRRNLVFSTMPITGTVCVVGNPLNTSVAVNPKFPDDDKVNCIYRRFPFGNWKDFCLAQRRANAWVDVRRAYSHFRSEMDRTVV